jgi:uncharacterized membrane protein YkvA (DUF1232 family)
MFWRTASATHCDPLSEEGRAWKEEARDAARDEKTLRREFWKKAKRVAGSLPFAEDLLAAYYCAFDHSTPLHVKTALLGAIAYFVLPFDFIPDMMPFLGYSDDVAVLIAALRLVGAHLRPEHREAARLALARVRNPR